MGKNIKSMIEETYKCPDCDYSFPVWRKKGNKRKSEHKKWLFCIKCEKDKNFIKQ
jgi:hypothetical protein